MTAGENCIVIRLESLPIVTLSLRTLFDPAARGLLCLTDDVMVNMLYDAVHGSTGTSSQGYSSASDSSASIFTCSNVSDFD